MVETSGKFCRGNGTEYPEKIHEIDIVDKVFREVKRIFHEVESQVIIQAHEYPQHKGADQVEREQFGGGDQMQVGTASISVMTSVCVGLNLMYGGLNTRNKMANMAHNTPMDTDAIRHENSVLR